MAKLIHMPEVAANATSAVLNEWLLAEGDKVAVGATLASIETDKALVDLEADSAGVLGKIIALAGQEVAVGAPIAVLYAPGESDVDVAALLAQAGAPSMPAGEAEAMFVEPCAPSMDKGERVFASPLARRLAREQGIDLASLHGSGPHGRIVKRDVQAAKPLATGAMKTPAAVDARYDEVPHTSMRRTIARRLSESKASIPHFYLRADCRMGRLNELRAQINAGAPRKISVNDLLIKAVASALREVPEMNVSWSDSALLRYRHVDIAVAVSTDAGLITPVLRDADSKTLSGISSEIADLAERARNGRLAPDEYQGGSFTLSNLGMFGVQEFSAIINPPQAAILAVGATLPQPVVEEGALRVEPVMSVTLSVDHRAIDGALAARWLAAFKRCIESPLAILV